MDGILPIEKAERPLRYLFLDLNSYFASVEQQERPELRGRPVAVAPVDADTTFVIAASYPAKAYGVKCGVMVREAKERCPDLVVVHARPPVYVQYHKRIMDVLETVLPIDEVCSIDEMRFRLMGEEKKPENAVKIAGRMKRVLREKIGECLTSSIGIAPNGFLAKVASDMQKPDGLVVLEAEELPGRLHSLGITDFAGLNRKMASRLGASGIFSAEDLCSATRFELRQAFGSVVGERWWYLLRGFDLALAPTKQRTLGHSNVLAPAFRTEDGCREMLLRLMQKAAARMRADKLWAAGMIVFVKGFEKSWEQRVRFPTATQDSVSLLQELNEVWTQRDFRKPRAVGVTFYDLHKGDQVTPSLFSEANDRVKLNEAVDKVNQKFGKNSVYLAAVERVKDRATEKIAFNKTWLFQEGKGDNQVSV